MGAIKTDVLYKSLDVFTGNKDISHVIRSKIREICIARPTIPLDMGLPAAFPFTKSKDSLFQQPTKFSLIFYLTLNVITFVDKEYSNLLLLAIVF